MRSKLLTDREIPHPPHSKPNESPRPVHRQLEACTLIADAHVRGTQRMNDLLLGSLKRSIGTHCRVTCTCFGCASNDPSPLAGPARRAARRGALDPTATTTCVAAASTDFSLSTIVNRITEFLLSAPKLRSDTNLVRAGSRFGFPGPRGAHAPLRLQRFSPRLSPAPGERRQRGSGRGGWAAGRTSERAVRPSEPAGVVRREKRPFRTARNGARGPLPLAKTMSHCLASSPARQLASSLARGDGRFRRLRKRSPAMAGSSRSAARGFPRGA